MGGEPRDVPPPRPLHTLEGRTTPVGWHAWCNCGQWEAFWTGPDSQRWALDDFDHHRRASSNGANVPPVQ